MSTSESTMFRVVLIICAVSATWTTIAPQVMTKHTAHFVIQQKLNVSQATQDMVTRAFHNYTAHVPHPNASWTLDEWDKSLDTCRKRRTETRKTILQKTPPNELKTIERYLDGKEAEENFTVKNFALSSWQYARNLNVSKADTIIAYFRNTLYTGCLREMPPKVLEASWNKCREFAMHDVPEEEIPRTDIFLRKVELYALPTLTHTHTHKQPKPQSVKKNMYTQWCYNDGLKSGISHQDYDPILDLLEEFTVRDAKMDKSHWTPKQWNDYLNSRGNQWYELIEKAVNNNRAHADLVRKTFDLIEVRHERLKLRDNVQYFERVFSIAQQSHLSLNTTVLLINELKASHLKTHVHCGFSDEDDRRADQELIMSYGMIKMKLLDQIPKDEQENVNHFFFMLSRTPMENSHDPQFAQSLQQAQRQEELQAPFENYTAAVATKCQMSNESLYIFWGVHGFTRPNVSLIKELNHLDFFERKVILLEKWVLVKNLTILISLDSDMAHMMCFFNTIEKEFVKIRRNALYTHVQTDEMNFVGSFRKEIRAISKRANITKEDLDAMLEIVKTIKPTVALPENDDPTLMQLKEAYNNAHSFMVSFKDQCHSTIKDREGMDRFFKVLNSVYNKMQLTNFNLEDNGFICDTPEGSDHVPRKHLPELHPHHPPHHQIHNHPMHGHPIQRDPMHAPPNAGPAPYPTNHAALVNNQKVHHHHGIMHPHIKKHHHSHNASETDVLARDSTEMVR